jgi:hypothetical protein
MENAVDVSKVKKQCAVATVVQKRHAAVVVGLWGSLSSGKARTQTRRLRRPESKERVPYRTISRSIFSKNQSDVYFPIAKSSRGRMEVDNNQSDISENQPSIADEVLKSTSIPLILSLKTLERK